MAIFNKQTQILIPSWVSSFKVIGLGGVFSYFLKMISWLFKCILNSFCNDLWSHRIKKPSFSCFFPQTAYSASSLTSLLGLIVKHVLLLLKIRYNLKWAKTSTVYVFQYSIAQYVKAILKGNFLLFQKATSSPAHVTFWMNTLL